MRWQQAALAFVVACGTACGDDGGGGSTGEGSAVTALEARLVTALCQSRVACGLEASQASCEANVTLLPDFLAQLADDGRVALSSTQGDACVAALGSIACDSSDPELRYALRPDLAVPPAGSNNPCDLMLTGTLGSDVACASSFECESAMRNTWLADDRCGFKAGCTPPGCTGECITQQECDGLCHHDEECPPNEYCNVVGSCQLTFDAGDTCDTFTACLYPSQCVDFMAGNGGTCSSPGAPAASGQPCTPDSGCTSVGDSCLGSDGSAGSGSAGSDELLTCVTLAEFGSACSDPQPCVPAATCTSGTCM